MVTFENYFDATSVKWTNTNDGNPVIDWIKNYIWRGDRKFSPYGDSISQYILDRKNGIIYRYSDHWGNVGTCVWPIDHERIRRDGKKGITIAWARLSDFRNI